jgi:hypothetical protein
MRMKFLFATEVQLRLFCVMAQYTPRTMNAVIDHPGTNGAHGRPIPSERPRSKGGHAIWAKATNRTAAIEPPLEIGLTEPMQRNFKAGR